MKKKMLWKRTYALLKASQILMKSARTQVEFRSACVDDYSKEFSGLLEKI